MARLLRAACHHCRGSARTVDLPLRCSNAHVVQPARLPSFVPGSHAIVRAVEACGPLWNLMTPCVFRVKPRPTVWMGYRLLPTQDFSEHAASGAHA